MIKIVAICGESGSGKDFILEALLDEFPRGLHRIVSHTTREKREGEIEGVDYYFIDRKEMFDGMLAGEFVEGDYFMDNGYGTKESSLSKEKVNIGIFSPNGIYALLEQSAIEVHPILVDADEKTRFKRMMERDSEKTLEELFNRHKHDKKEFSDIRGEDFFYFLDNSEDGCLTAEDLKLINENILFIKEDEENKKYS